MPGQSFLALVGGRFARIVSLQASAGTASAGAVVGLNPSGLVDVSMLAFTSGSNANGRWSKTPDGTVEQRGEVALSAGTATIAFPIPFTSTDIHLSLTPVLTSAAASDVSVYLTAEPMLASAAIGGSITTVGLSAAVSSASFKIRWKASGV